MALPQWRGGQYLPLSDDEARRIIESAFHILEDTGAIVATRRGREALARAGAQVQSDGLTVKFPRPVVEAALQSAPSRVTLCGRDPQYDCVLEANRVHVGTGGTALNVLDLDTGERRPSTLADVYDCARLTDALENLHVFTINVFPNDITDRDDIDVNRFFWSLAGTAKHVMGGVYSEAGTRQAVALAQRLAGGAEALRERPFVSVISLVISPLKIDDIYGEIACWMAEQGLPVVVPSEPICGTTSPVTPAANVLMHVTEALAAVTMIQAVNPGTPTICGSVGSTADLRTARHLSGCIERGMLNAAVAQIAQRLQLPYYSTAGTSDSKLMDAQAAYESALSSLLVMMSGANYIHDAAGLTEFDLTVAFEKMIIDNEILGMAGRVLRGIEVSDETLAVDLICEVGPGKHFIAEDHTVQHMRGRFFEPTIANREPREQWEQAGALDATEVARRRAKELLAAHQPPPLPDGVVVQLRAEFPNLRDLALPAAPI